MRAGSPFVHWTAKCHGHGLTPQNDIFIWVDCPTGWPHQTANPKADIHRFHLSAPWDLVWICSPPGNGIKGSPLVQSWLATSSAGKTGFFGGGKPSPCLPKGGNTANMGVNTEQVSPASVIFIFC